MEKYSSPPTQDQTMPRGYNQIPSFSTPPPRHSHNQSNSLLNLLQFPQEKYSNNSVPELGPKNDDEYGFLWDMSLEETSFENGVAPDMDEMRFEMDHNSMVLL